MKRFFFIPAILLALVAAAAAAAYPQHAKLVLRPTSLGSVLADGRGHSLYLFGADKGSKSVCYGQCAALWPPFLTAGKPTLGAGVKNGLLTASKRKDGKLQVVYAGHPLYFFSGDTRAGQVKGEGIVHFGGTWYAVNAAGTKVAPKATTPPTTTTNPYPGYGGGGNYGP
jgi:predicted lipoprotein with Yx(FWY)xxD motif